MVNYYENKLQTGDQKLSFIDKTILRVVNIEVNIKMLRVITKLFHTKVNLKESFTTSKMEFVVHSVMLVLTICLSFIVK